MKRSTARAMDRSLVLLATICLAGNAYHVPARQFWDAVLDGRRWLLVLLLLIVGLFGAFSPIESFTARRRADRNVTIRHQILSGFGHLLDVGRGTNPPLNRSDLGLHIWRIRRTYRHPVRGVLSRVATYRLGTTPVNRTFEPPRGVGVVGLCWKRNEDVGVDVEELARKLTNNDDFGKYVRSHGGDAVMNLSWANFNRVKHRGAVFANPIRNGRGKFIGCISVDASHGFDVLNARDLKEHMSLLCVAIGAVGFESV